MVSTAEWWVSTDDICCNCSLNMESRDIWGPDLDWEPWIPTLGSEFSGFFASFLAAPSKWRTHHHSLDPELHDRNEKTRQGSVMERGTLTQDALACISALLLISCVAPSLGLY